MDLPIIYSVIAAAALVGQLCHGCGERSREVGNCLHTFLERDFQSIEAIIFPDKSKNHDRDKLLLDGPELENTCHRIDEVVQCLEELQHTCYYYRDFFPFRNLVSSLRKAIDWTCSDLRGRFRTLLIDFHCIEMVRLNATSTNHDCHHDLMTRNIWQQIIRREANETTICPVMRHHFVCLNAYKYFEICDNRTTAVYMEIVNIFTNKWCPRNRASVFVYSGFQLIFYSFQLAFVTIVLSQLHLLP